ALAEAGGTYKRRRAEAKRTGTGGFGGGGGGVLWRSSNKCNGACSGQCKSSGGGGGGYSGGGSGVNEDQAGGGGGSYCSGAGCSSVTGGSVNSANPHTVCTDNRWDPWDPVVQARILPLGTKHWSQMKAQATANCPSTSKKDTSVQVALPDNEKQQKSAGGGPEKFNRPRTAAEATTARRPPSRHGRLAHSLVTASGLSKLASEAQHWLQSEGQTGLRVLVHRTAETDSIRRYSTGAKHMQYGLGMAPRS
uniref:AP2/ERF domain-containing protein n=1 Tax=Macrostomum lignano TaxID=282301 RepID=A0A1I8F6Y4_9PLAT